MADETFGEMVYRLRKARRWSQEELASRARITQSAVSQVELDKGKSRTSETVQRLAAAFDADPHDWLVKAGVVPARQAAADRPLPAIEDVLHIMERDPEIVAALDRLKRTQTPAVYDRLCRQLAEAWRSNGRMMLATWETAMAARDDADAE